MDSSSASAKDDSKLRIPSDAKIFNDKIFGTGGSGDPYAVYLNANTGLQPDKWNPADIWVMTPAGIKSLVRFNHDKTSREKASVALINNFLIKQFESKDIIPISLKKTVSWCCSLHDYE